MISYVVQIHFLRVWLTKFSSLSCLVNVYVPKDRVTNLHQGYGFVEFRSEEDADYVSLSSHIGVMPMISSSSYTHIN